MMTQTSLNLVTRELVPEYQRLAVAERLFGMRFPLELEPTIYNFADRLSDDYKGGYWDFYLVGPGFFMAPSDDRSYHVVCDNQFDGHMMAITFGITVSLYSYSHLSFISTTAYSAIYADHYHRLLEYAMYRSDAKLILQAID